MSADLPGSISLRQTHSFRHSSINIVAWSCGWRFVGQPRCGRGCVGLRQVSHKVWHQALLGRARMGTEPRKGSLWRDAPNCALRQIDSCLRYTVVLRTPPQRQPPDPGCVKTRFGKSPYKNYFLAHAPQWTSAGVLALKAPKLSQKILHLKRALKFSRSQDPLQNPQSRVFQACSRVRPQFWMNYRFPFPKINPDLSVAAGRPGLRST
jgi:hypothetical protein